EPQRTYRDIKAFLFFVIFVPLCGVIKIFHTEPQRTFFSDTPFIIFYHQKMIISNIFSFGIDFIIFFC
ncbi:MAG: hypothetical protein DRI57_14660, partial [Deltaproteobacteria bacterium]